jgi:hypothetical protein
MIEFRVPFQFFAFDAKVNRFSCHSNHLDECEGPTAKICNTIANREISWIYHLFNHVLLI